MIFIVSFSFLNGFLYLPLGGLFKINFKLPCISAYANLKFALSSIASFALFSSSTQILDWDGWEFRWIRLFSLRFYFLLSFSFFLVCLRCLKKPFSLKLWIVSLTILVCLPFLVLPIEWSLSTCLMNSTSFSPASLAIGVIILLL